MLQQQNYPVLSTCKTINDSVHVYNYFKKLYCSFKGGGVEPWLSLNTSLSCDQVLIATRIFFAYALTPLQVCHTDSTDDRKTLQK